MKKSPLAAVKARFGEDRKAAKAELVKAVRAAAEGLWTDRLADDDGLDRVSNAKLLRLEASFKAIKKQFATREKLIAAVAEAEKRKDAGFAAHLGKLSSLRLWDRLQAAQRAARKAAA